MTLLAVLYWQECLVQAVGRNWEPLCFCRAGCTPQSYPLISASPALTAWDVPGSVTSVRHEETSLMLPSFPFLALPVLAFGRENKQVVEMLPLTQPKWQVSSWCGMLLVVRGCTSASPSQWLLFSLPGKIVGRGSILGVGEDCSSVCAVIKAGYLDFLCGWPKWCCGWASVAHIPGYLLKRFLGDHPKNKRVPSKVYSVHAWSQKLASILLSFPVNFICFLLMLQLCVGMGTLWPFGMPWVQLGPQGCAKEKPEPRCKEHEGVSCPDGRGLQALGRVAGAVSCCPAGFRDLLVCSKGGRGCIATSACHSAPHLSCGIGA